MLETITPVDGICCEYRIEEMVNVTIDALIDRGVRFSIIQPKEEEATDDDTEY